MKKLNITLTIFGLVILTSIISSCNDIVNINDYLDKNIPLSLTIKIKDSLSGQTNIKLSEIAVNSDKFKKIIQWGNDNTKDWQWTPASYIADIYIVQNNFTLRCLKNDGVVISYIDKDGKPRQFTKTIKKGELDFLTNQIQP